MTMNEYDSPGLVQHLGGKATAPHREGWGTSVGRLRHPIGKAIIPLSSLAGYSGSPVTMCVMNLVVFSARIYISQGNLVPKGN